MLQCQSLMRLTRSQQTIQDIEDALFNSAVSFGKPAARRYRNLIQTAMRDVAADPELTDSSTISSAPENLRIYHLRHSKQRAVVDGLSVKRPRHVLIYQVKPISVVIVRVLHERMDFDRHL